MKAFTEFIYIVLGTFTIIIGLVGVSSTRSQDKNKSLYICFSCCRCCSLCTYIFFTVVFYSLAIVTNSLNATSLDGIYLFIYIYKYLYNYKRKYLLEI